MFSLSAQHLMLFTSIDALCVVEDDQFYVTFPPPQFISQCFIFASQLGWRHNQQENQTRDKTLEFGDVILRHRFGVLHADLGVDLGSRLEVDLNVPSRLKSLLSTVKSVLPGTVCFV